MDTTTEVTAGFPSAPSDRGLSTFGLFAEAPPVARCSCCADHRSSHQKHQNQECEVVGQPDRGLGLRRQCRGREYREAVPHADTLPRV